MPLPAGTRLGPYEILAPIGAGGMGEVYRARDTRLDRIVAIKVVLDKFSERFEREAHAVAALNHPHIGTLYDVGPNYLVMEFLEGEPLHGPLPLSDVLRLALQIADALDTAHKRGIVHRDLKPANILVTSNGRIKILDFGLASIQSVSSESDVTHALGLTEAGTAVGTIAYMSPEQARGEAVDARSDLWSFGVVLYELVTGMRPFEGSTTAVTFDALLNKTPEPVRDRNPKIPAELEAIINKALEKHREMRYQSAADMRADLLRLERSSSGTQIPVVAETPRRSPWRKYPAIAALLIIAALAGFYVRQRAQAKTLTDKDVLVLADFTNTTGDSVFDGTLREALATKLEQSPFLKIMDDGQMRRDIGFMGRPPGQRITNDIAQEICQRERDKAMIQGSIASLGKTYAIALQATSCKTGETLAREQVEAEDKEHVLRAVSTAATSLRAKLGESLSSIQKLDQPLDQVTTTSLEAFQAYALGREQTNQGSFLAAIPFLQRATELDPNFAYAWLSLGNAYGNSGDGNRSSEFTKKAYSLSDHVSERERLAISSRYFLYVTGELDKALTAAELLARTYPRYFGAHNTLANLYRSRGEFEKALTEFQESSRLLGVGSLELGGVIVTCISLDRFDEAKALAQKEIAEKRDPPWVHALLLRLAQIQGDRTAAGKEIRWFAGKPVEYQSLVGQATNAYALGQFRNAEQLLARSGEIVKRLNLPGVAARIQAGDPEIQALVGNCEAARSLAQASSRIGQSPLQMYPTGLALSFCGDAAPAMQVADEISTRFPLHTISNAVYLPSIHAALDLNRDQPGKAIELLQSATPYERAYPESIYLRGLAYLRLRRGAEAAAEFQKILDHKGANWGVFYCASSVGLGRAAALSGDTAKSKKAYQDFFTLWKDADPDVPLLIEAKKEYAALL